MLLIAEEVVYFAACWRRRCFLIEGRCDLFWCCSGFSLLNAILRWLYLLWFVLELLSKIQTIQLPQDNQCLWDGESAGPKEEENNGSDLWLWRRSSLQPFASFNRGVGWHNSVAVNETLRGGSVLQHHVTTQRIGRQKQSSHLRLKWANLNPRDGSLFYVHTQSQIWSLLCEFTRGFQVSLLGKRS